MSTNVFEACFSLGSFVFAFCKCSHMGVQREKSHVFSTWRVWEDTAGGTLEAVVE